MIRKILFIIGFGFLAIGVFEVISAGSAIFLCLGAIWLLGLKICDATTSKPTGSELQSIESQKITEDIAYEMVAHELELGEQQIGLWTKAFADADGDENKQRSLYIKMRVAELTGDAGQIRSRPGAVGAAIKQGVLGILGFLGGVLFLGYAITQIYAGFTGIDLYFGQVWASIAVGIAIFLRFTLPITIGAFYCAMEVWHLHWGLAALFAAPGLAFVVPGVLFSIIDGIRK